MNGNGIQIEKLHPEYERKENSIMFMYLNALRACAPYKSYDEILLRSYPLLTKKVMTAFNIPCRNRMDADSVTQLLDVIKDPIWFEAVITLDGVLGQKDRKPDYYVIQKEFYTKFLKVNLNNLKFKHLPESFIGYIKLPIPIIDSDGSKYHHIYVYIGDADNFFPSTKDALAHIWRTSGNQLVDVGSKLMQVALVANAPSEYAEYSLEGEIRTFGMRLPKDGDMLIEDLISKSTDTIVYNPMSITSSVVGYPDYLKQIISLLLYINSGDPDIRDFQNTVKWPNQKRKPLRQSETLSTLDNIKLVGFHWKKEILKSYSAISWEVDGHFRWQRHGHQLSLVKLIWIDPHPAFRST